MAGTTSSLRSFVPNRRRRVRHRVQTPAYATFTGESKSAMLDLHEIVDISEDGISIHCHSPLEVNRRINLCLDLAECSEHIYTTGQVVWAKPSGRTGLRFSGLAPVSLLRLREWLFLNAMSGLANADEAALAPPANANSSPAAEKIAPASSEAVPPSPGYTDTLAALTAVQREVEALGRDLAGALRLIANRTQTLVRASGAAIALADSDPDFMVCRASSGDDAPSVGARLQVGSGFSGECVKSGRLLRCEDTETDARVDRASCRALGIRSILAVPVRAGEKSIGILEAFSPQPATLTENDSTALIRFSPRSTAPPARRISHCLALLHRFLLSRCREASCSPRYRNPKTRTKLPTRAKTKPKTQRPGASLCRAPISFFWFAPPPRSF